MTTPAATVLAPEPLPDEVRTTSGRVAMGNLQAQIDGLSGRIDVQAQAGLVDLLLLRGHLLGLITDHERAEATAEQLTRTAPSDGDTWLARARTRATFHHFPHALRDLDAAQRLGAAPPTVAVERASVLQALGRYDESLVIVSQAVDHRRDFHSLGALASLYAECGAVSAAERAFSESRSLYRGVSPIPLAQLDFQRAHMWLRQDDLGRARCWLADVVGRLPAYAPAQGHLAEAEAALGETDAAIARLRPLTTSSDDPDYAAQLARILREADRPEEADEWRDRAAVRYDELISRHLEAYADHAADFWLSTGGEPHRAAWLARRNLQARPTRRARELVARASSAAHRAARARIEA